MSNIIAFVLCFLLLPLLLAGLLGLLLGWLFFRGKKQVGDLSVEGEGALRAEANSLRARVQELEGHVSTRDGEVSDLKSKLAAAAAGAGAAGLAATAASKSDDDDSYALEWRNRYLAARVKYLEGRLSDAPKAKKKPAAKKKAAPKKAAPKKKPAAKKKAPAKTRAKAAPKPKVLYTDGPTDGKPDDLKLIKGIGPKFEKDLNGKGIYYFRQIANWKAADVKMVEGVIDSIPGRIKRDEWVRQAKGLAKSSAKPAAKKSASKASASKTRKKPGPKPGSKRGALTAAGKPRKKPGPKPGSTRGTAAKKSDAEKAMDKYYANVQKYDRSAKRGTVESIVKYCGVALRSRDSSLVACSDETEKKTVAKGFVTKKLGLNTGQEALVEDVCAQMKGERFKNRVTFYYLAAKKAGKLSMFGG